MADADKTTATDEVEPIPEKFTGPTTLEQKQANGGWKRASNPSDGRGGPGKNLGGTR
jgi:hypothetical protein